MLRSQLRRRTVAVLASAAAVSLTTQDQQSRKKLSIYEPEEPETLLVDLPPSKLEEKIGVARRTLTKTYQGAYAEVQGLVSKWIGVEHAVERRVKSIIPRTEQLTPGILYVGIATLTGSILARNRGLPTRLLFPPTLFILSMKHFLPQTSHNLSAYLASLEEEHFATIAEKHNIANAHTRMTWERAQEGVQNGRAKTGRVVEGLVRRMQGLTGLKLKEAMGWDVEGVAKQAESKVLNAVAVADRKVSETEDDAKPVADKKPDVKRVV